MDSDVESWKGMLKLRFCSLADLGIIDLRGDSSCAKGSRPRRLRLRCKSCIWPAAPFVSGLLQSHLGVASCLAICICSSHGGGRPWKRANGGKGWRLWGLLLLCTILWWARPRRCFAFVLYCHVHCETDSWLMNVTILVCGKDPVPYTGKFDIILLLCHMSVWHVRVWYVMGVKLSVSETSAKHWTCLFIPRIAQHVMMLTRLSMSTLWRTTVPLVPSAFTCKGGPSAVSSKGS